MSKMFLRRGEGEFGAASLDLAIEGAFDRIKNPLVHVSHGEQ